MNKTSSDVGNFATGWVPGPNGRGTGDILWSSFFTIFLCTWTAICLNIPHPDDNYMKILCRKGRWMFWGIIGPELVLSVAIGQYASARRSVKRFHQLGAKWTIRHGFFADMGGMLLQPKDSTPFLVNSRQLAYLVEKKYVRCPVITEDEIWDKSKADILTRILTMLQASWLMIQLISRAILKLPTSTLELSAAAIVFCTFGTHICWLHKPSDVSKGIILDTEATTAQILVEAGDAAVAIYRHPPLDFVAKESFTCGYDVMGFFNLRCDNDERPLCRFSNDRFPDIGTIEKFQLFCLTTAFASFHLIGWKFTFPTRVELILWRVSSLIMTGTTVFFWVFETIAARHRFGRWDKYLMWIGLRNLPRKPATDIEASIASHGDISHLDAFEKEQKQAKPILIWEVGLIFPIVILYATARGYMIVEVFASLRQLPLGVYKTFDIGDVFPHW
ncbi:hypothetical protein V500_04537 [Pseudogymnoascus sp. VKM F-4518 (FW-2643)]|nr:hypothetical protein V500_04537 [Pseudogymnoascus sp. VKM F-4518 (FW-2643)]